MAEQVTVKCNGGISALSAFFNGVGSSIAVGIPMELTMRVARHPGDGKWKGTIAKTIGLLKKRYGVERSFEVYTTKSIPQGKGLKSSSALTLCLAAAFLKLNQIGISPGDLLDLSADLSIENGTSATGAFDDLCSSYYGGICLTDNMERKLIFRGEVTENRVVVAYSSTSRSSASVNLDEMKRYSRHADVIQGLIEQGMYYEAMTMNGTLLGNIYGYNSYLIRHFLGTGATYSSQCGKGPAVFAVFESSRNATSSCTGIRDDLGIEYKKTLFSNGTMTVSEVTG